MRPKQWIKNGFLLAGLIFDRQLGDLAAVTDVILGVILFSLIASSVYLINDLNDIETDLQHPIKKLRPIAAGQVSKKMAWVMVGLFLFTSLPLAYLLSPLFSFLCVVYFGLNITYSIWIKHIVILDVLVLASFYILRVAAGLSIIEVERFSPWMYAFTLFLALFLGFGKRRAELVLTQNNEMVGRKVLEGYTLQFLDQLITIVLSLTILTYSLYTFFAPGLPENNIMMLTIPFVIYGIFRYLYLIQVEERGESPEDVLFSDKPFQANLAFWAGSILLIFYLS